MLRHDRGFPLLIFAALCLFPREQADERFRMQFAPLLPPGADANYQALLVHPRQLRVTDTVLGKGAFGIVCLGSLEVDKLLFKGLQATSGGDARDCLNGATSDLAVAVKTTLTDVSGTALTQLLLEARLHACLAHRNIVTLLAVQEAYLPVMMAMTYCSGGDLRQELRRRAAAAATAAPSSAPAIDLGDGNVSSTGISEAGRRDMITQVSAGLRYLHSKLCIHRDVAARNVLLVPQSEAGAGDREQAEPSGFVLKLADLGLSRVMREEHDYYRVSQQGKESSKERSARQA